MVLVTPFEDLKQAPDLDVAPDDGVDGAALRALDEVRGERSAVGAGCARSLARDGPESAHVRAERARADPELLDDRRRRSAQLLGERVQEMLDVHRIFPSLLLGASEQSQHRARQVGEPLAGLGQASERRVRLARHVGRSGSGAAKDFGHAGVSVEGAREEMNRLDLGVLPLVGEALGAGDEGFGVGCVAFEVNRLLGSHDRPGSVARAFPLLAGHNGLARRASNG